MEKLLKSDYNKMVIENFILWHTHNNREEAQREKLEPTEEEPYGEEYRELARLLYIALDVFIAEDHIDGEEGNEFEVLLTTQDTDNELTEVIELKEDTGEFINGDLAKDVEELFFDVRDAEISKEYRGYLPCRFAICIGNESNEQYWHWYSTEKDRDADYNLLKTALVYSNFKFVN